MAKRTKPHIDLPDTGAAVNVADGLAAGQYQFQAIETRDAKPIYYAFVATAPTDIDDYFSAEPGELVSFRMPDDAGVWCRTYPYTLTSDRSPAVIALSSL